jgi:hypothetical protein
MGYIGGDIIEVVASHPTLGDFRFSPKANEAFTYDPGGIRNNDDKNGVTGNGQTISQKNRVRWSVEGPIAVDLISDNELSALPALAADPQPCIITITHISGDIRKGTGEYVGDIEVDSNTAQLKIKFSGGGNLEKIA